MARFIAGLVIGAILGGAGGALATEITGSNGFLNGWFVTRGKEVVCENPFVFTTKREIDCH
jgi:hypothetical protein